MVKQDFINTSPVRNFDNATDGGLKAGEMGIITAKKGLGKTSVLVQFGIDALLHDRHLVHVSFDQKSSDTIAWYESVLAEMGKKKNISDMTELSGTINRDRTILNVSQETFTFPKVVNTLNALKEGGIKVGALVIDGADFKQITAEDLKVMADFVKAEGAVAWFSSTNESPVLAETVCPSLEPSFATVGHLASDGSAMQLYVLKNAGKPVNGISVKLDAKTMLMTNK